MSGEDTVPTFSIIIPTIGRASLCLALGSIAREGGTKVDEIIVVGDGPQPAAKKTVDAFAGPPSIQYFEHGPHHQTGGPQRNFGMTKAKGTHMIFLDDDDVYVDGAIREIRSAVSDHPKNILIFREQGCSPRHSWKMVWRTKEVKLGNVGTQGVVIPNIQGRIGKWGLTPTNDYDFIRSTVDLYPNRDADVVWIDRVIAHLH